MKNINLETMDRRFIEKILYFDEIDSTNDRAKDLGTNTNIKSALLITEYQTKGRGRMGRSWEMPKGKDLMFSLLLRPGIKPMDAPKLTIVFAQTVVNVVKKLYNIGLSTKWPNDVIYNGRKVCGILTEMNTDIEMVNYVVIGAGINCNNEVFSKELNDKAVALKSIVKAEIQREELLQSLIVEFERLYNKFLVNGLLDIISDIRDSSAIIGREVHVMRKGEKLKYKVSDISTDGELLVVNENKEIEPLISGELLVPGIYGYAG